MNKQWLPICIDFCPALYVVYLKDNIPVTVSVVAAALRHKTLEIFLFYGPSVHHVFWVWQTILFFVFVFILKFFLNKNKKKIKQEFFCQYYLHFFNKKINCFVLKTFFIYRVYVRRLRFINFNVVCSFYSVFVFLSLNKHWKSKNTCVDFVLHPKIYWENERKCWKTCTNSWLFKYFENMAWHGMAMVF